MGKNNIGIKLKAGMIQSIPHNDVPHFLAFLKTWETYVRAIKIESLRSLLPCFLLPARYICLAPLSNTLKFVWTHMGGSSENYVHSEGDRLYQPAAHDGPLLLWFRTNVFRGKLRSSNSPDVNFSPCTNKFWWRNFLGAKVFNRNKFVHFKQGFMRHTR